MRTRFALAAAFVMAVGAGTGHAQEPGSFFGDGCVLDTEATLCDDCIAFEHVTTLGGDPLGPGYLGEMEHVVRDGRGNYWVGQNEGWVKVFDPDGAFLGTVGRSGEGPMEFGWPRPMHADASARVHVFDNDNLRISVIDADWRLVEEKRLPAPVEEKAPLDDGDRYVVQASIEKPGSEGMPLHIIDATGVLKSFGAGDDPNAEPPDPLPPDVRLAVGPDGGVFAARMAEYEVEAWSREGVRLGALRGEPGLMNTASSFSELPSSDNPPPNIISDIHVDPGGLLWVSLAVRRPGWLSALAGDDPAGIVQGRLDVIDPATCTMIASQWHDQALILLENRTVAGYGFTELGSFALDIMRVRLNR